MRPLCYRECHRRPPRSRGWLSIDILTVKPARHALDGVSPDERLLYGTRKIVPASLEVIKASWRKYSIVGDSYESPHGGWDTILSKGEGTVTRELHWPKHRLVLRAQGRLVTDTELEIKIEALRGRSPVGCVQVGEKLAAAGFQTTWDLEITDKRGSRPLWMATRDIITRMLQQEQDHRLHRILEDAVEELEML